MVQVLLAQHHQRHVRGVVVLPVKLQQLVARVQPLCSGNSKTRPRETRRPVRSSRAWRIENTQARESRKRTSKVNGCLSASAAREEPISALLRRRHVRCPTPLDVGKLHIQQYINQGAHLHHQTYSDGNGVGWYSSKANTYVRRKRVSRLHTRGTSSLSVLRLPVENFE